MLGLSGLAVPEDRGLEGVDLSEALRGRSPPPELLAFSHTTIPMDGTLESEGYEETFRGTLYPDEEVESIWVSIRKGDRVYKWRHFGNELWRGEVFDLAADPFELRNLFDEGDGEHRRMARLLVEYKETLVSSYQAEPGDPAGAGREAKRELLKSLGYL
ncbi:MAG: hypothetical protein GY856_17385 [bacterium]|nr:hypothetical protein [bacterium]